MFEKLRKAMEDINGRHRKAGAQGARDPAEAPGAGGRQAAAEGTRAKQAAGAAAVRAGEIVAYRAWQVYPDGSLRSVWHKNLVRWPIGTAIKMSGNLLRDTGIFSNNNGIHVWKTIDQAVEYSRYYSSVAVGEVEIWGTVDEHQRGYRAEYAKPTKFVSWPNGVIDISDLYASDRPFEGVRWHISYDAYCRFSGEHRLYETALDAWWRGETIKTQSFVFDVHDAYVRVWSPHLPQTAMQSTCCEHFPLMRIANG